MHLKPVALLTGPYDWDATLLPIAEFEARLAAVRRIMAAHNTSALIVHGNSSEYGALAYLTNFVPKLGPAFALISPNAPLRLLVSGSPTMLSAAQRLTWIEDVRPIADLKNSIELWREESLSDGSLRIALWGDSKMALRPYQALKAPMASRGTLLNISALLDNLRRRKSSLEVKLIRRSCEILTVANAELARSFRGGLGARACALAAEHAAYRAGAQHARVLVSARPGGPPQFLDFVDDPLIDPLLVYIAVRFAGYWSEGFASLSRTPSRALEAAQCGLAAMLKEIRAGISFAELAAIAAEHVQPYSLHTLVKNSLGNSIGLSIEEPCESPAGIPANETDAATLEVGGVYTLRCGAASTGTDNALVSAMIHVTTTGTDILWPSP